MVDPWALLQAGFWLSFVAVGVLFATDSGASQAHKQGFKGQISSGFREQWVITLALTPLTLLLFGQVSIVGLAANALAIPWVTLLVTPLAMAGVLFPLLWDLAALAIAALAWYLKILPFASFTVAQAPLWAGMAGVMGGLVLAMPWPWRFRFLGLPLVLPVLLWQAPRPVEGQFELLAADIGQGNAVVVRTANHALVYDAGPRFSRDSDAGHRVLVPLLRALDVSVDRLMISHRDNDHVGGALAVLSQQPQADLMSSVEDDNAIQAVRQATRCLAGQHWRWDGVDFDVLHPRAQDYEVTNKSNAMSCTLRISNGQQSALLAGDLLAAQEARLVAVHGAALKADLLLVPHHGSKTSSSAAFLDTVQPGIALVQAGYRNRYGHPAAPVLVRYEERKIQVVDSPHCGAATWQSEVPQQITCQREKGLRYWHHRVP
jgi:competence protein ComEC